MKFFVMCYQCLLEMLLGRPWQFDRKVMCDGYLNRYFFIKKNGRKATLVPLSSAYVFVDQLKLEKKRKSSRKKN